MNDRIDWDKLRKIAIAHQLEEAGSSSQALLRFLRFWWCKHYNRPFLDPLLLTYTTNELCYEYLRHFYSHPDNDPKKAMEVKQAAASDDEWVKKMLASQPQAPAPTPVPIPPPIEIDPSFPDLPEFSTKFDSIDGDPVK